MAELNFHLAPPPKTVDGLLAVPIDIQSIDAKFEFDGATQSATADATIAFVVGPTAGNPIFDLRQTITAAWLDGAPFPVAQLASHDFGAGLLSELRVLQSTLGAGSAHTLRVRYSLGIPAVQLGGAYPPAIEWTAGPKLRFSFGLSDLNAGRYLEAWLPANLIFDQFGIDLDIRLISTPAPHSVITNGQVTVVGANHWSIKFPKHFTALSPLLEVRASDAMQSATGTVTLPVSGADVSIEAWKLTGAAFDLPAKINDIKNYLSQNENGYGAYAHGNRFVAFFIAGGMEYEGGTTTEASALLHETFHSWFARGIKPSGQEHGWWDEAFTTFHDQGADDAIPFDFSAAPITLCSRDPWQRRTPSNAYSDGARFWKGIAAMLGVDILNGLMSDCYTRYRRQPVSTQMIEELLVAKSGKSQIVDAFHRFVYGFPDPAPPPDLWLKDAAADTGSDLWQGEFWDSPDLWVRNQDDGQTGHQSPEAGQDNWFYARVRNRSGAGACKHFVVTFAPKPFAGTEFVYPADFLPSTAAKAEFDLAPGQTRIVKARWPRSQIPPAGTHTCILASVSARLEHPAAGLHVWEHNNLAQKNLSIVDLQPNGFIIVPVVLRNVRPKTPSRYQLEIWRDPGVADYEVGVITNSEMLIAPHRGAKRKVAWATRAADAVEAEEPLDCGAHAAPQCRKTTLMTAENIGLIAERFPDALHVRFPAGKRSRVQVELPSGSQHVVGLRIDAPPNAAKGATLKTHLLQRHAKTGQVTGGIAVKIRVI